MRFLVPSRKAYLFCVGVLVLGSGLLVLLEGGSRVFPTGIFVTASVQRMILDVVLALATGGAGWFVCTFYGFREKENSKGIFSIPFYVAFTYGAVTGILLISLDFIFSNLHYLGSMPHPRPATALMEALVASGIHELLFRLVILGGSVAFLQKIGKWENENKWSFATLAFLSVVLAFLIFLPARAAEYGIETVSEVPVPLLFHIFFFYSLTGLVCAGMFYKHGFLASWATHFTTLFIWDVLWGQVWWRCLF